MQLHNVCQMADTSTARPIPHFANQRLGMLIGGRWQASGLGRSIHVENPATGNAFAEVPAADASDVELAVQAARRSFDRGAWRRLTAVDRERVMWRLSDLIESRIEEFIELEVWDNGMPASLVRRAIERAIDGFRYYAGICTKIYGATSDISGQRAEFHAFSVREPVGVAGLIIPWNSPLSAALNKVGPCLAAGCSAVLKPAEQTPLSALRLGELALEAGVPEGVLNVVTGTGVEAGAALANHPDVDKVSFTGSTEVGKLLVHAAAGNLKRLSLELGGKSPVFIFADADLKVAIPRAAAAIFSNSGQICYAGSLLFVQRPVFDKVVMGIAEIAAKMRIGDGFDESTELGPLISAAQRSRVLDYIADGKATGAELVTGGRAVDRPGYFVEPTVFIKTKPEQKIVREEIFGPVLAAMPFEDLSELPSLANATSYGLGAGIFTSNLSTAHKAARAIRAGNVWVNFYGGSDKSLPFGGFKQSGWGREGAFAGLEAFLEEKSVYVRL